MRTVFLHNTTDDQVREQLQQTAQNQLVTYSEQTIQGWYEAILNLRAEAKLQWESQNRDRLDHWDPIPHQNVVLDNNSGDFLLLTYQTS